MSLEENRYQSPYEDTKRDRTHYNIFLASEDNNNRVLEPSPGSCPVLNARYIDFNFKSGSGSRHPEDMRCPICGLKRPEIKQPTEAAAEAGNKIKIKKKNPAKGRKSFVISHYKFNSFLLSICNGSNLDLSSKVPLSDNT